MKRLIYVVAALILGVGVGRANADEVVVQSPGAGKKVLNLPDVATQNMPVVDLGTAVDPETGRLVQGYAYVHYKDAKAKPPHAGGGKDKGGKGGSSCYGFMAKGAKWKNVESWVVNPANIDGVNEAAVFLMVNDGVNTWEDAADGVEDGNFINILGSGSSTDVILEADTVSPDNVNEVYFADVDSPGAIAVTIVWGVFGGPPRGRYLAEWDQIYDDVDFDWTADAKVDPTRMDFANIAIHELGHTFGLADLYTSECAEETMYGYGTEGETKKRDLNAGDIAGIKELYK